MKLLKYEEYSTKTDSIFNQLKLELLKILPTDRVEHVGSSSIPGSLSKGDLDVFVGVNKDQHVESIELIKSIGFIEKKDTFRSDELCMLITDQFNYDVAIQVVINGSEFEDFIKFRNILRKNHNLVESYNEIKLNAKNLSEDEYRAKKSKFINNVLSGRVSH